MSNFLNEEKREELQIMSNLIRYNNAIHIKDENVAEHSFYVAFYTMEICRFLEIDLINSYCAVSQALIHDVHETVLSDIPHPVKTSIAPIQIGCSEFEYEYNHKNFEEYFNLLDISKKSALISVIVNISDIISVIQYANQECSFGNKRFEEVRNGAFKRIEIQFDNLEKLISKEKVDSLRDVILRR